MFALCTPVMAAAALSSVVLFGGFRIYDALIDGALIYLLFFKRIRRGDLTHRALIRSGGLSV